MNHGIIFGMFVALNIIGALVYGSIFYFIGVKEESITVLLTSLRAETKKALEIKNLTGVVQETEDERKKIDSYFLRAKDIVSFIESIESLGKNAGVAVAFESVNVLEGDQNAYLAVDLKTEGGLSGTVHFLSLLELLPYSVSFERVFIEQKSKSETTVVWAGSFLVRIISFAKEK